MLAPLLYGQPKLVVIVQCGLDEFWVFGDDPLDEVRRTLARHLRRNPKLEILNAVVVADAVHVVDVFVRCERPAEVPLHDHPVFASPAGENGVALFVDVP